MSRPHECEHGRLARKCERCDDADTIAELRAALPSAVWLEWIADSFVGVTHPNAADMRAAIHAAAANIRALDAPPATVAGAGE